MYQYHGDSIESMFDHYKIVSLTTLYHWLYSNIGYIVGIRKIHPKIMLMSLLTSSATLLTTTQRADLFNRRFNKI